MDEKSFPNHALVVCPPEADDLFLAFKREHPLKDFALYSLEDLEDLFAYEYDDRALAYLLKKGHGYSLAKDELKWLSKLTASSYKAKKLQDLAQLRDELIKEGFLYQEVAPERTIVGHPVLFYGYADMTRFSNLIDPLPRLSVSPLFLASEKVGERTVYAYEDIYGELRRLFNEICHDIDNGTKPDDIYIVGADSSYYGPLKDFARYYGVAVELPKEGRLYDEPIYRSFRLNFLARGLEEALSSLEKDFPDDPDYPTIYRFAKRFATLFASTNEALNLYDDFAKAATPKGIRLTNAIHLQNSYFVRPGAHYYVVNFALGVFPKSYADSDFLSDLEKKEAGLPVSSALNHESLANLSSFLESPSLVYLSYKEKDGTRAMFPSGLVREKGYKIAYSPESPYEYSHAKGTFYECSLLDKERKYLYRDPTLSFLSKRSPIAYNSFDYSYRAFPCIEATAPRTYSYSSLKTFEECPFHYYLDHVLRVDEAEPRFSASLGTIFHSVLQHMFDEGFSFEETWRKAVDEERAKTPFSNKEEALLLGDKNVCKAAVDFHLAHQKGMENPLVMTEKPFKVTLAEHPLITLCGQIDAAFLTGKEERYLSLLDYKTTASQFFDEDLVPLGFSLQLPLYAFACASDPSLKEYPLIGLFIADVLPGSYATGLGQKQEDVNGDLFRLRGVYLSDPDKIKTFDNQFMASTFVKGLKYSVDKGFGGGRGKKSAKSADEIASFAALAGQALIDGDAKIRSGDFAIAPKKFKSKIDACKYCPYRDVCYRPEKAVIHLDAGEEEEEDESDE